MILNFLQIRLFALFWRVCRCLSLNTNILIRLFVVIFVFDIFDFDILALQLF